MSAFAQSFVDPQAAKSSPPQRRPSESAVRRPSSGRMQAERNGAMPMPVAASPRQLASMPTGDASAAGLGPLGMPRSPPKNKNTAHVPCKFFIYGQCQAGRTCPFSHDLESSTRPALCKYFAKGSCKFGRKCALLHVTPDGTVVNRAQAFPPGPSAPPFPPAAQVPQVPFQTQAQPLPPPGLLAQGLERRFNGDTVDPQQFNYGPRNGYDAAQVEMTYQAASPQYGSPVQDSRFAGSPPTKGLSVLDAPLPNSFDSNGVSMAARNGPFAASVPSRFGVESPPASLPRKSQLGNTALRDLHNSAFGDRGMDGVLAGSSPPSGSDEPLTFPKRPLHSELFAQRQMLSTSLGTKLPTTSFEYSDDDDDGEADRGGDLLPASLHDLIPENFSRRGSRARLDDDSTPASFLAAQRRTLSGHGTPQDSKVGSPHSSSPSRYTGVFMRRPENEVPGHLGSPLRNSNLSFAPSSLSRTNGDMSPTVSSPPRQASMSMLTQELQRTKLDAARSQAAAATPGPAAPISAQQRSVSNGSTGRSSLDRGLSSASVGRARIDEEQELFDMDELGDHSRGSAARNISSGTSPSSSVWGTRPLGSSPSGSEPQFGAIGSHRASK